MTQRRRLLTNSTTAYVLGVAIIILLHETAHSVAAIVQGSQSAQTPFSATAVPPLSDAGQAAMALAGPIFSLVLGLVMMTMRPLRSRPFWDMLWVWSAFLSAEEGFGYFTIAGIISAGDTGEALQLLHAPGWAVWVCLAIGIGGLFFLAARFAPVVRSFSTDITEARAFAIWPWLIGTGIFAVLMTLFLVMVRDTGVDTTVAVLAGAVSLGVFAPMSMMFGKRFGWADRPAPLPDRPVTGLILLAVLVLFDLFLTTGPKWG